MLPALLPNALLAALPAAAATPLVAVLLPVLAYVETARTAWLDRLEQAAARCRKAGASAPVPIRTAQALFASGLSGSALEDAFAALSLRQQRRYVNDPRHARQAPDDQDWA